MKVFANEFLRSLAVVAGLIGSASAVAAAPDVPTGSTPSPLFGATAFSQPMLRFEEFGPKPVTYTSATTCPGCTLLPAPTGPAACTSSPSSASLDAFLGQALPFPLPQDEANTSVENPWALAIRSCLGIPLTTSAIEGRPPGA